MKILGAEINQQLTDELAQLLAPSASFVSANEALGAFSGIVSFFDSQAELDDLRTVLHENTPLVEESNRAEYGDFQTNTRLAGQVCSLLKSRGVAPETVIEPTFGKGSFVLAALQTFDSIREIVGVEIYKPYIWQTKFDVLAHFFANPDRPRPVIRLLHGDVFGVDFKKMVGQARNVLVLGNPPWVTNAMLSSLESDNLPTKSNFKKLGGLDAMTGKGNFDIAESITLALLRTFHRTDGHIAFLVKNTVVKNLLFDQRQNQFALSEIEKHNINAPEEFGAAVDASLFLARFNSQPSFVCRQFDFYRQKPENEFGWSGDKFVSNLRNYQIFKYLDGKCPFEWRQGLKHDCSKIMEFERENSHFRNGKGEVFSVEEDLVFGLLKSSDLKPSVLGRSRKNTLVTQRKIGQDTRFIETNHPQTWAYLTANTAEFANRKSSIYVGKPAFSIFGVGDYSFAPFKVAISGMYKNLRFSLVLPADGKPLMLDDTCYFIGFERLADAVFSFLLLNSPEAQHFLESLVFWDSKRAITKDLLMRIDFGRLLDTVDFEKIISLSDGFPELPAEKLTFEVWENYCQLALPKTTTQFVLF